MGEAAAEILHLALEAVVGDEVAGGGAADAQDGIDFLHRADGGAVELEVTAAGGIEKEIEVGLVPTLEVPLADFLRAVAAEPVAHEGLDELRPLVVILRRGDMGLPPEGAQLGFAGDGLGEKAELDEGADAGLEHGVEEIVEVLPVEDELAVPVAAADEHVVVKQAVEAQIAEAAMLAANPEMIAPAGAQTFVGAPGADANFPEWFKVLSLRLRGKGHGARFC